MRLSCRAKKKYYLIKSKNKNTAQKRILSDEAYKGKILTNEV